MTTALPMNRGLSRVPLDAVAGLGGATLETSAIGNG